MKADIILKSGQMPTKRFFLWLHSTFKKLTMLLILVMLLSPDKILGQNDNSGFNGFAINPKIGYFKTLADRSGYSIGSEVIYIKNKLLFSADYYKLEEFVLFKAPVERYNHLGLMFGSYSDKEKFRFQYQIGLGLLWGITRTDEKIDGPQSWLGTQYEGEDFSTLGLTSKLGFKLIQSSTASVGLDLHISVNSERTVCMPFLSAEMGLLRKR
ncbi:MAG: hypothetical protein AAGA77_05650 [Bacteroidota bacterium]